MLGAAAPSSGAGRSLSAPARAVHAPGATAVPAATGARSADAGTADARAADAAMVDAVVDWFAVEGRDLPWRHEGVSAWAILVSEVMLQQTPVVRVLPHWQEWMERWPSPAALADAPTAEVLR